ncbi:MAG: hypothetical protein Q9159_004645 [Coniocarpon cinnabarinum]
MSPTVLRHTPRWLERPSPGFKLFNDAAHDKLSSGAAPHGKLRAHRPIAHKDTEIFVAVGNQLRWSDLVLLKEQDYHAREGGLPEDKAADDSTTSNSEVYRVLKVPIHREIRQLVISPNGDYLAILTSHTVHIAQLPHCSQLDTGDNTPLKVKSWQVGPTAHVVERAPVTTALWHPLADGQCLVTVTEDAVVRLWELNPHNRWSFDNPGLALDLRKLSDPEATSQDFSPTKYGTSSGFSPDDVDMEAAAACFGGCGAMDEGGWAPLTLWVAMTNGDIYALCPFLPSQFFLTRDQVSSLAATVDCAAELDDLQSSSNSQTLERQQEWVADVMNQQRQQDVNEEDAISCSFIRPERPAAVPALQGPYHLEPDSDGVFDVTDICAVAKTLATSNDSARDVLREDGHNPSSPPAPIICVVTSEGTIHVLMDTDETQALWISDTANSSEDGVSEDSSPALLLIQSMKVCDSQVLSWPLFSPCADSRQTFFLSHVHGVSHVAPCELLENLTSEIEEQTSDGSNMRLQLLAQSSDSETQPIIHYSQSSNNPHQESSACVHVQDSDLRDFVLVQRNHQPYAATLSFSNSHLLISNEEGDEYASGKDDDTPHAEETRASFTVPPELFAETTLPMFAEDQRNGPARQLVEKELRLAPATVSLMMEAHRLLGTETGKVQDAVSNLFQRCERMQDELKAQLERVGEISGKVESVIDDNADASVAGDDEGAIDAGVSRRLQDVGVQRDRLQQRFKDLMEKAKSLDCRPLNDKERQWTREVSNMQQIVDGMESTAAEEHSEPQTRYEEIKSVKEDLVQRCQQLGSLEESHEVDASPRKQGQRMGHVNAMLERETALVDATSAKLEQLKGFALTSENNVMSGGGRRVAEWPQAEVGQRSVSRTVGQRMQPGHSIWQAPQRLRERIAALDWHDRRGVRACSKEEEEEDDDDDDSGVDVMEKVRVRVRVIRRVVRQ